MNYFDAENFLYAILTELQQFIQTFAAASMPNFKIVFSLAMVTGGVLGGFSGQIINKRLSERQVELLFNVLLIIVVGVCIYNAVRFGIAL